MLVRSRSRVHLCRHTALVQLCTPACACANQRGQGRAFGLSLFPLRRTSPGHCPLLTAPPWPSPWRFASCTRPQRRRAPSLWPFSARLATGFRPQPHTFVPGRGSPVRCRLLCRPELHLGQEDPEPKGKGPSPHSCTRSASTMARTFGPGEERTPVLLPVIVRTAPPRSALPRCFATKSRPQFESLTPLHLCAPKRTHVHARSHRHGRPSRTAVFRRRTESWRRRRRA
jgi:hypothetical protein